MKSGFVKGVMSVTAHDLGKNMLIGLAVAVAGYYLTKKLKQWDEK